jgi:hypothetical protein
VGGMTFQRTVIFAIHTHASVVNLCAFSTFKLLHRLSQMLYLLVMMM